MQLARRSGLWFVRFCCGRERGGEGLSGEMEERLSKKGSRMKEGEGVLPAERSSVNMEEEFSWEQLVEEAGELEDEGGRLPDVGVAKEEEGMSEDKGGRSLDLEVSKEEGVSEVEGGRSTEFEVRPNFDIPQLSIHISWVDEWAVILCVYVCTCV